MRQKTFVIRAIAFVIVGAAIFAAVSHNHVGSADEQASGASPRARAVLTSLSARDMACLSRKMGNREIELLVELKIRPDPDRVPSGYDPGAVRRGVRDMVELRRGEKGRPSEVYIYAPPSSLVLPNGVSKADFVRLIADMLSEKVKMCRIDEGSEAGNVLNSEQDWAADDRDRSRGHLAEVLRANPDGIRVAEDRLIRAEGRQEAATQDRAALARMLSRINNVLEPTDAEGGSEDASFSAASLLEALGEPEDSPDDATAVERLVSLKRQYELRLSKAEDKLELLREQVDAARQKLAKARMAELEIQEYRRRLALSSKMSEEVALRRLEYLLEAANILAPPVLYVESLNEE